MRAAVCHESSSSSSLDASGSFGRPLTQGQIDRYWRCRKSLRLWPIVGPDMAASVRDFLRSKLEIDGEDLDSIVLVSVEKVVEPRSKVQHEAVVEFASPAVRDSIKSSGFKLEGKREGIRIEVPNFLKTDFQALQNLSYKLKMANPGMKRSMKFDDEHHGLMLDIQASPGDDWQRIRADQARLARKSDPLLRSGPAEISVDSIADLVRAQPSTSSVASGSNATPLGSTQSK